MPQQSARRKIRADEGSERGRLNPDIFHAAETNDVTELMDALAEGQRLDDKKRDLLNMTPAHVACIRSSTNFMLAACAEPSLDPWHRDDNGRLPFDHASARGNRVIMKALFDLMYPAAAMDRPQVVDFPTPSP